MLCRGWESINYALFGASLMGLEILRQRLLENRENRERYDEQELLFAGMLRTAPI